jgi:hypothetical protein
MNLKKELSLLSLLSNLWGYSLLPPGTFTPLGCPLKTKLISYFYLRSHVPEPWGELMVDPEAPIIDFYPEDFKIDLNGKKFAWQGVALLPFVDEVSHPIARIVRRSENLY